MISKPFLPLTSPPRPPPIRRGPSARDLIELVPAEEVVVELHGLSSSCTEVLHVGLLSGKGQVWICCDPLKGVKGVEEMLLLMKGWRKESLGGSSAFCQCGSGSRCSKTICIVEPNDVVLGRRRRRKSKGQAFWESAPSAQSGCALKSLRTNSFIPKSPALANRKAHKKCEDGIEKASLRKGANVSELFMKEEIFSSPGDDPFPRPFRIL